MWDFPTPCTVSVYDFCRLKKGQSHIASIFVLLYRIISQWRIWKFESVSLFSQWCLKPVSLYCTSVGNDHNEKWFHNSCLGHPGLAKWGSQLPRALGEGNFWEIMRSMKKVHKEPWSGRDLQQSETDKTQANCKSNFEVQSQIKSWRFCFSSLFSQQQRLHWRGEETKFDCV